MCRRRLLAAFLVGGVLCPPAFSGNWIQNGDFESDQPLPWSGAAVEREVVHAGEGSLRLEAAADEPSVGA